MEQNILQTFAQNHNSHQVLLEDTTGQPTVILKNSEYSVEDLERFAEHPDRIREVKQFQDLRGFIDYVNDFKNDETVCFAGRHEIKIIFNYHTKDKASWGSHVAIFKIEKSQRWRIWEEAHNKWMSQKRFADFLDSGLNEIIDPAQAEILTLVKNFRATTSYEFDSEASPCGGENLTFRKTTKGGSSKKADLYVPEYITLALQPFENLVVLNDRLPEDKKIPAYSLQGKISWQANLAEEGVDGVSFKVQILNVENVINQTLEIIKNAVVELTNIKVYIS